MRLWIAASCVPATDVKPCVPVACPEPVTEYECVLFIDDTPVAWRRSRDPGSAWTDYADVLERLGDRGRVGMWDGPFPLTGDLLERSLALHDDVLMPILKTTNPGWFE
jgi:hypothetical protein